MTSPASPFSAFDVLDHMAEAVSIIGPDGRHMYTNAAADAILEDLQARHSGRALAEVSWASIDAAGEPLPPERLPAEITRTTGEECTDVEVGFPGTEGQVRWIRINTRPLSDSGPPYAVVVSFLDVTEAHETRAALARQRRRYRTVVESLHEGLVVHDEHGRIVAANPRAEEILQLTEDQLAGRTAMDPRWRPVDPDGTPSDPQDFATSRARLTGEPQIGHKMGLYTPDGELHWLVVNATPLHDADGTFAGVAATFVDETERVRDKQALERATRLFSMAFAAAPTGMALVDLDGSFMQVNRALCELTGYSEADLLARTFQEITHPDDLEIDLGHVQRLLSGEINSYQMQKRYLTASGTVVWVELHGSLVRDGAGLPQHFIAQIEDITERRRMKDNLRHLANHDGLTGLWNRRRFEEDLQRQVGRCLRYRERAALMMLDLDRFKDVNDRLGHKAGDDLLVAVAEAMRTRLRSTDSLARLGGDEFAVLLPDVTPDDAARLAEEIAEEIRSHPILVRGEQIVATASIGVAFLDDTTASAETALMNADIAMYRAKEAGRDGTALQERDTARPRPSALRVLHCDDSAAYRRLVEVMLVGHGDIELVASVAGHSEVVDVAGALRPDVVLLDARVPGGSDHVVAEIRAAAPGAWVVVISGLDDPTSKIRLAADGFVLKTRPFDEIVAAIRERRAADAVAVAPDVADDAAIEVVRAVMAAFETNDVATALRHAAHDVEFVAPGTAELAGRMRPYRGHDGVREYFADTIRVWDELRLTIAGYEAKGSSVVVFGSVNGVAGGNSISHEVVWVWELRGGQVASMRVSDVAAITPSSP